MYYNNRLFGSDIDNEKLVSETIDILILPKVDSLFYSQKSTPDSLLTERQFQDYLERSRKNMKRRCVNHHSKLKMNKDDAKYFCNCVVPTNDQLKDITKINDVCSLSGIPGKWGCNDHSNLHRFSWDHIIPLSKEGTFSKNNLQGVIYRINRLKGNESDAEVKRFITGFRNEYKR